MKNYKLIFADLDGTLIKTKTGSPFPKGIWDMEFRMNVLDKIDQIGPKFLAIVTNQGGIGSGFLNERHFTKGKMNFITMSLKEYLKIPVLYNYCSTTDENCKFRKPNTGMLESLLRQISHNFDCKIEKSEILMIGDASGKVGQHSDSDKVCAQRFGIDYLDVEDLLKIDVNKYMLENG